MAIDNIFIKIMKLGAIRRVKANGVEVVDEANRVAEPRLVKFRIEDKAERGRKAWHALHSKELGDETFVSSWIMTVPGNCKCRNEAIELMKLCPPRYDSPEDWFAWTVEFHNLVNAKLIGEGDTAKRIITLEEAREIWRR